MENELRSIFYKAESGIKEIEKKAQAEIADVQKPVLKASVDLFSNLGWNNWNEQELGETSQYTRIQKSFSDNMTLTSIDYAAKSGQVLGSELYDVSGNGCTCNDFLIRRKPCKHMYFLAEHLARGEEATHDLQLKLEDISESKQPDFIVAEYGTLGCCSLFRDCSRAGHCLQDDDYYRQCAYHENLEKGKVFYTEQSNNFNPDRYKYIENFRCSLDENDKNAFDEILLYFEKTKRGCQKCFCLFSSTIYDIIKNCNAFEFLTAKELVKRIFEADLISNTRAMDFYSKYSKLPAPHLKTQLPKLPDTATNEEKEKRKKENQKINAQNLKTWEQHYLTDTALQEALSKEFLFFKITEYDFELDEFFIRNNADIIKKTNHLVYFDALNPKVFREKIV